jgi:protein kinase C and casein kinase substrate in neurons protein
VTHCIQSNSLRLGDQLADIHLALSTSLNDELVPKLRQWRKDHYEKSRIHYKVTKEFEKEFLDAQQSWSKLLERIGECKAAYFAACKTLRSANEAERTGTSDEQRKKHVDKADVARRELESNKEKYRQAVQQATEQRTKYISGMQDVFERTQTFEKKRLDFFKTVFEEYAQILQDTLVNK